MKGLKFHSSIFNPTAPILVWPGFLLNLAQTITFFLVFKSLTDLAPSFLPELVHLYISSCKLGYLFTWLFFNPTIEVVTFCLHGWCMLGVFVDGIHPSRTWMSGSLESVRWNACVHRLDLGLYSHPKKLLGNGVRTHDNSKGKIPSTRKILLRGSNPQRCIAQDSEPNTLPNELFQPLLCVNGHYCCAVNCALVYS